MMRQRLPAIFLFFLAMFAGIVSVPSVAQAQGAAQQWLSYYKGNPPANFDQAARFIQSNSDFPAMGRIRAEAERVMPANYPDQKTFAFFAEEKPQTFRGMKIYASAIQRAGDQAKLQSAVREWWKTASLSRSDQQEAYATFKSLIDRKTHEDRLRVLIHREQYTNARALALVLGAGHAALTETRIALKSGKGNPDQFIKGIPQELMRDEGLLIDRIRYRRKDDNNAGAIELLNLSPSSDAMYDSEDWGKERGIIARRLFEQKKYSQAYKLVANHKIKEGAGFAGTEWMAGWLALEYLNKPWEAFEHFERLYHNVETPISKSRAAYWAGLASERLNHAEIAKKWYEVGAKYKTTFYGQLSSEKLGRSNAVTHSGVSSNSAMKNGNLAQAAGWLKRNGHKAEANMFLTKMIEKAKTPGDYAAVAEVANGLSMRNMAIKAAQESEKTTGVVLLSYAFPKVENQMGNIDFVEWALVHALIRQESRYDDQAVSSAGARGLMQLMPRTAKEVAGKAGLSHQTGWLTSKPSHNIALGSRYLRQMLNRYNGNYAMALAAYNAGPGRVDKWINEIGDPRNKNVDLVNWIEQIPIYETRNYVQRVLEGVEVYRHALSNNRGEPRGDIHLASR